MKFTAEHLTRIVAADVRIPAERAGVEALGILAGRALREAGGTHPQAEAVARLVERRLATPVDEHSPKPYTSPLRTAQPRITAKDGRPVPLSRSLTPVDLAWLDRLPSDAAKLTPEDVAALGRLRAECRGEEDQRLLSVVLAPVVRREEAREQAAQVELEKYAARPRPRLPASAHNDLVAAVLPLVKEAAPPELTERDIEHRASDLASDLAAIAS